MVKPEPKRKNHKNNVSRVDSDCREPAI